MRIALPLVAALLFAGCQKPTAGDNVRRDYDNKADAIENQADAQPNKVAQKIYKARADAIREEGKDREKGIEGREPSGGQGDAGMRSTGDRTQTPQ